MFVVRVSTTPATILTRVTDRILAEVAEATPHNTYVSTRDDELPPNPDEVMFQLGMSVHSDVEQELVTGAGNQDIHLRHQISVTIHSTVQRDEVGRDLQYLTDDSQGMLQRVTSVLGALSGHDLVDGSGNELLAQPLRPSKVVVPPRDDRRRGKVTVLFDVEFDWAV